MSKTYHTKKVLRTVGYVIVCVVLLALVCLAIGVLVKTFKMETRSPGRIMIHRWLFAGFIAFFPLFIIPRVRKNLSWMMKFTHEFIHLLFALFFFRKIYRFKVDSKDSYVSYSSGWFGYHAITLSPYFVPVFTFALLPWRITVLPSQTTSLAIPLVNIPMTYLAIIDILIGFTYAFHVCCWIRQIHLDQTDITGPGTIKSVLCIILFQIINFCAIVLTPTSGVFLALNRVFVKFPMEVLSGLGLF